jgi:hypothetical protein
MTKAKHGICIAALVAALAAPTAWADDSLGGLAGVFEDWLAQLEALWLGNSAPADDTGTAAVVEDPVHQPELGPVALPNG